MTGSTEPPREPREPDRRARRAWIAAGVASLVGGGGLALLVGVLGGSGENGFRVFLLVTALGTALSGLYATATLLIDDLRGRGVSRARVAAAVGLFVVTALVMAMVAGIGG